MPASSAPTDFIQIAARRVVRGYVDLFIAPALEDGTAGERYHMVRSQAGEPLLDIGLASGSGFLLLESPSPDARIEPVANGVGEEDCERWIRSLTATATRQLPGMPRPLVAGRFEAETPELVCTSEVLWVAPLSGNVRFNDILELRRGIYFPIAPGAFLALSEGTAVECVSTREIVARGLGAEALAEFHRTMLGWLALRLIEEMEKAAARRQRRQESEASLFARSLTALADTSGNASSLVGAGADPLRNAVMAVWSALGIEIDQTRALRLPPAYPEAPPAKQCTFAEELAYAAAIRSRRVKLNGKWWKGDAGPLLGWLQDVPVALLPAGNGYEVLDPRTGVRTALTEEMAAHVLADALMFYRPFPSHAIGFGELVRFALERRGRELWSCVWTGAAAGILALLPPIATGILVDHVIPSGDRGQLLSIAAILVASAIASTLFLLARQAAILRLEMKITAEILPAIWDRLLRLPASFFRQFTVGDLGHRAMVFDDTRRGIAYSVALSVFTGMSALLQVTLLATVSAKLALLAAGLLILAAAVSVAFAKLQTGREEQIADVQGKLAGRVLQLLNGVPRFRTSGAERRMFVLWAEQFRVFKSLSFGLRQQFNRMIVFQSVFPLAGCILLFSIAGKPGQQIPAGGFVVFLSAFLQALAGVVEVSSAWTRTVARLPMLSRALPILQTEVEGKAAQESPGELSGAIEANNITFRYGPGQPLVLRGLSFKIEPGEMVAFVGDSGAGKSTLVRLLLGFEAPESGTIRFDNQDLAGLDIEAVRKQMGVVLQSGRLLTGEIQSNILGATGRTLEDAWEAARLAGIADEIRAMPMGMYTLVGEGGSGLSGGQRQRLLVARAIVARPKILLLDEATSALDNLTQAQVTRSLESLRATRIIIAHRLSTIQHADRIFVLEQGRVLETGTYEQLMAANGKFAQLAARQLL